MLRSYIEEMGHEYEFLLQGAVEDDENNEAESDPMALMASSRCILDSYSASNGDEE